jgi:hypothetical protein
VSRVFFETIAVSPVERPWLVVDEMFSCGYCRNIDERDRSASSRCSLAE